MNMNRLKIALLLTMLSAVCHAQNTWHAVKGAGTTTQHQLQADAVYGIYRPEQQALLTPLQQKGANQYITLPTPDGTTRTFRIWSTPILPSTLAARYPDIITYTGVATDNPAVTIKIDNSNDGFHAMIFDGHNTYLVDPTEKTNNGLYLVHYKKDERKRYRQVDGYKLNLPAAVSHEAAKIVNGNELRTYRIAIACDHQYAQAAVGTETPTKQQTLNRIITTLNRINGVYERELSITFKLADNEDTIIFISPVGDPFGNNDNSPQVLIDSNQKICDRLIGTANYDIGHIFSTGAGGYSVVGCVCNPATKAQSVTGQPDPTGDGFDIDYVAHEIGHECGALHTFNNGSTGACGGTGLDSGNANPTNAYEPGSGSTIMAYAGICGTDNLQLHSDDYFHVASLAQISYFMTHEGNSCALKTASGNKPAFIPAFAASYAIPYLTPFELTAPIAIDSVADTLTTYCWEQYNLGDFNKPFTAVHYGPIFRSYKPDTSATRVFPNINMVLAGIKSDAGQVDSQGEKLADRARFLTFKLTVRNILNGLGCFQTPDDTIHLDVINTGAPFEVTSQNATLLKYLGGSQQTVTWNVVGSNLSPIGADSVDIYLSVDGGYHWTYILGSFPNNGSAVVTLPNPAQTSERARIKVKGRGNVFFNVNKTDFFVVNDPGASGDIVLFPVPARNDVTIVTGARGVVDYAIFNMAGKLMTSGTINKIMSFDVAPWPRGVYIVRMKETTGQVTIKKFVLE